MKSPSDFLTREDWLDYVRENFPAEDAAYAVAVGQASMYQQFYELRSHPFPERFTVEMQQIAAMAEPARTHAQEALNSAIMADMIQFLMTASSGDASGEESAYPVNTRQVIDQLLEHLRTNNPYFVLWEHYKRGSTAVHQASSFKDYLVRTMGHTDEREIEFANLISELRRCLDLYSQRAMSLPKHFYFQIWFLHRTHGQERNAMTRALVQDLVEGLEPCASA